MILRQSVREACNFDIRLLHDSNKIGGNMKANQVRYCAVFLCLFLLTATTAAASPIAKIAKLSGDAFLVSEGVKTALTAPGAALLNGDLVQTQEGQVDVLFNDGFRLTVHAWSTSLIEVQEETSFFTRVKSRVRRISLMVGKIWIKSSKSKTKSYLQTPTAVCALRGTEGYMAVMPESELPAGQGQELADHNGDTPLLAFGGDAFGDPMMRTEMISILAQAQSRSPELLLAQSGSTSQTWTTVFDASLAGGLTIQTAEGAKTYTWEDVAAWTPSQAVAMLSPQAVTALTVDTTDPDAQQKLQNIGQQIKEQMRVLREQLANEAGGDPTAGTVPQTFELKVTDSFDPAKDQQSQTVEITPSTTGAGSGN
jgi:hypothetical protein